MTAIGSRHRPGEANPLSRLVAVWSLAVLTFGAVLFVAAWLIGGPDATADNWVGITTVLVLFTGLFGSLAALVMAVVDGLRHGEWSRRWLPLLTFPCVLLAVALLEALAFE